MQKQNIANFTKNKYLLSLPILKEERSQKITTIIFTLIAISIFGFFAISPTLSTITQLRKQVNDAQFVHIKLQEKRASLSILQNNYIKLEKDIPVIFAAVPENPEVPYFSAEIQALAQRNQIHVTSLQVFQVEVASTQKNSGKNMSFSFSLDGEAAYPSITNFVDSISKIDRNISITSLTLTNNFLTSTTQMSMKGKAYFKSP